MTRTDDGQPRSESDADLRTDPATVWWPGKDRLRLEDYRVRNRDGALFDVRTRIALLGDTEDPHLHRAIAAALTTRREVARELPTITYVGYIPPFYGDREPWRRATRELVSIEHAVSALAAAFVASRGELSYAERLLDLLAAWASGGAFGGFHFTRAEWQAWFALEQTLFAIALSHAVIRPFVTVDRAAQREEIDIWLNRTSRLHLAVRSEDRNFGWNNHFYRRALHAVTLGVLTGDDDLFRYGVSAIYHALTELDADGALPREVQRGSRAVHYQNYAFAVPDPDHAERGPAGLSSVGPCAHRTDHPRRRGARRAPPDEPDASAALHGRRAGSQLHRGIRVLRLDRDLRRQASRCATARGRGEPQAGVEPFERGRRHAVLPPAPASTCS